MTHHNTALDFKPELLRDMVYAHLEDVLERFDTQKVSGELANNILMRKMHLSLAELLPNPAQHPDKRSIRYVRITEKENHFLIVYHEVGHTECAFGILPNTYPGQPYCIFNLTIDDIVNWLMPENEQDTQKLRLYHDALLNNTNDLTH